jgi:hypothetical protein
MYRSHQDDSDQSLVCLVWSPDESFRVPVDLSHWREERGDEGIPSPIVVVPLQELVGFPFLSLFSPLDE